jgi:hypothetical protein
VGLFGGATFTSAAQCSLIKQQLAHTSVSECARVREMCVWLQVLWTGVLTVSSRPTRYDALGLTCCPGNHSNHPPLQASFFVL